MFVDDKALGRLDVETGRLTPLPGAENLLAETGKAGARPRYATVMPEPPRGDRMRLHVTVRAAY